MSGVTTEAGEVAFFGEPHDSPELLAILLKEAAYTQGAGTPLDGYPSGTRQSQDIQLGILEDMCQEHGWAPEVVVAASGIVRRDWANARVRQGSRS